VVLFDEIEKRIRTFSMLLQVLDDGRITDGRENGRFQEHGHHHDLEHQFSVNHGGRIERSAPATGHEALRAHFRPEFLNPWTRSSFSIGSARTIWRFEIQRPLVETSRNRSAQALRLGRRLLAREGYDPVWGASAAAHNSKNSRSTGIDILGKVAKARPSVDAKNGALVFREK
jgi:ATP-dependent Clp protease ATP-binding subunit ClpA